MATIQILTDANWQDVVQDQPALLIFTDGSGLRSDFDTQFKKSAKQHDHIVFGKVNPAENPELAARFDVKNKPVMVGYYGDECHVRRVRPWGTDVVLALELLNDKMTEANPQLMTDNEQPNDTQNTPVNITGQTFQEEVIDYSHEMPVLVDFWADWCGPCKQVAPILDKLADEFAGQIRVAKVDTDANQELAQAFSIMSIPTIMIFKDGQLVFSQPGAFPEAAFRDLIQQVIELDVQKALEEAQAREQEAAE